MLRNRIRGDREEIEVNVFRFALAAFIGSFVGIALAHLAVDVLLAIARH